MPSSTRFETTAWRWCSRRTPTRRRVSPRAACSRVLPAGALVLSDPHDFVQDTFGDCVLYIDDVDEPGAASRQIVEHVQWANANPEVAADMARRAQEIFKARFSLDDQLREVCTRHERLAAKQRQLLLNRAEDIPVDVVLLRYGEKAELPQSYLRSLARVRYGNLRLHIVGDAVGEGDKQAVSKAFGDRASFHAAPTGRANLRLPTGALIAGVLSELTGEVMIVSNGAERWFGDSIGRIVRAFEDDAELAVALGDYITRRSDKSGAEERAYTSMQRGTTDEEAIANLAVRRHAYETLRHYCDYLDGEHWHQMLATAFRGQRLRKIGHHGLLIDLHAHATLAGWREEPLLDATQQAALIADYAEAAPAKACRSAAGATGRDRAAGNEQGGTRVRCRRSRSKPAFDRPCSAKSSNGYGALCANEHGPSWPRSSIAIRADRNEHRHARRHRLEAGTDTM